MSRKKTESRRFSSQCPLISYLKYKFLSSEMGCRLPSRGFKGARKVALPSLSDCRNIAHHKTSYIQKSVIFLSNRQLKLRRCLPWLSRVSCCRQRRLISHSIPKTSPLLTFPKRKKWMGKTFFSDTSLPPTHLQYRVCISMKNPHWG